MHYQLPVYLVKLDSIVRKVQVLKQTAPKGPIVLLEAASLLIAQVEL